MAETLPYMNSTGLIAKILEKIKTAQTPDRFSIDFMDTVLGFGSGSARPFIPMAKRLNLITSDGVPTDLYRKFRGSTDEAEVAMAQAIRHGYAPLFKRNEFAYRLDKKKLEGLIREVTGVEEGNSALRAIVGSFEALKKFADFEATPGASDGNEESDGTGNGGSDAGGGGLGGDSSPIRFGYTININLPDTNDIAVFNAIFKSMKEHLL